MAKKKLTYHQRKIKKLQSIITALTKIDTDYSFSNTFLRRLTALKISGVEVKSLPITLDEVKLYLADFGYPDIQIKPEILRKSGMSADEIILKHLEENVPSLYGVTLKIAR